MDVRLKQDLLKLEDVSGVVDRIESFLKDYVNRTSADGVVFGMSGGLDSSVVAALCSRAFRDSRKVLGLCMPEEETYSPKDVQDAERVAKIFDIDFRRIDVTPMVKVFKGLKVVDPENRVANGNVKARIRAVTLFYHANVLNRLVVGTTDKSEMMLG